MTRKVKDPFKLSVPDEPIEIPDGIFLLIMTLAVAGSLAGIAWCAFLFF